MIAGIVASQLVDIGPAVDLAPVITSSNAVSIAENATLSHALTANESVTWSIVGGADQARFELSGSTLRWLSNGTKNFEVPDDADTNNTYIVTVRATDVVFNTTDQTITATVTDVDEVAPTITSSDTANVAENATLSHSLTANEAVTWSLVGGADQARFELSGSTLRWLSNGVKDFEAPDDSDVNNTYVVTVRATDTALNTTDQTITVTVTDVDESLTTPSFRSQAAAATSASTTVAPAYPAGLAADDILILAVNFSGDGVTVTTPADFTQIGNTETFAEDPSTNDMMSAVYWKRATGSESGNLTVTRSGVGGGASFFGAALLAYQDALDSGDPTEAISDVTDATSPYTMGGITTLGPNRRVISVFCVDDNEARTSGPESGWANRVAFLSGTGTDGTIVVDDAEQASAGSPTNNTFGTTSDQGAGIHAFALKPNPA